MREKIQAIIADTHEIIKANKQLLELCEKSNDYERIAKCHADLAEQYRDLVRFTKMMERF